MATPAGVTTCLVYKKAPVSFGGGQATVALEVAPSMRLVHTATGTPFADFIETVTPAEGGVAQLALPHTEQDGFQDTDDLCPNDAEDQDGFQDEAGNAVKNWHYEARIRFKKGKDEKHLPVVTFQIPAGQAEIDLSTVPAGPAQLPTSAPVAVVTSLNGATGAVDTYLQLARTPEDLFVGAITYTDGAPTSAAVVWPDGTEGIYTGTPSAAFPGSIDAYTITRGTTTYTQPAVTRDAAGYIINQPAIEETTTA